MERAATEKALDASMVIYRPDADVLVEALRSLARAAAALKTELGVPLRLWVVDNTETPDDAATGIAIDRSGLAAATTVLSGHGNLGYGGGHNLAIRRGTGAHHLVLNYDLVLADDALTEGLRFMRAHPEVVLASPRVVNERGEPEFLCKRAPNVLDLALRGFAPPSVRARFRRRLDRYEMRDVIGEAPFFDVEHAGGAFMLFDRWALTRLGGFDERFFLYFEDFDLSKRARELGLVAYAPSIRITHYGGKAARKGWLHRRLFVASAWRYFAKHGLRLV